MEKLTPISFIFFVCMSSALAQNASYDAQGRLTSDPANHISLIEWNNIGKVWHVIAKDAEIEFSYDGNGNRVRKLVKPKNANGITPPSSWEYTYYQYAQDNEIARYIRAFTKQSTNQFTDEFAVAEQATKEGRHHFDAAESKIKVTFRATESNQFEDVLYLGIINPADKAERSNRRGQKRFGLRDHVKSISGVVSDRKTQQHAELIFAQDYYPFGMTLADRAYENDNYLFGFNGQERVKEINSDHYTAAYWEYDARLGRRWNLDPVVKPNLSSYSVLSNSPIARIDPNGDDDYFSAGGELVNQTNKGTNIYIENNGQNILFHEMTFETKEDRFAAKKILAHYAQKVGVNTAVGTQRWYVPYWMEALFETPIYFAEGEGEFKVEELTAKERGLLFTDEKLNITLPLYQGKMIDALSDYNNLMSTIYHENLHRKDLWGTAHHLGHAGVHLREMQHHTFKNTTLEFKIRISYRGLMLTQMAKKQYVAQGKDERPTMEMFHKILNEARKDHDLDDFLKFAEDKPIEPETITKYFDELKRRESQNK